MSALTHPGFAELVGFDVSTDGSGVGNGRLTIQDRHLNPNGVVHGGVLFTLIDTAMGAALMLCLDEGDICATIQISMNYLKPVVSGVVECQVHVVNRGRRFANLHGELYVGEKLVGTADGNFAIVSAA